MAAAGVLDTIYNSRNPTRRWLHWHRFYWNCWQIRGGESAIDVGCGNGEYLTNLCRKYRQVTAMDYESVKVYNVTASGGGTLTVSIADISQPLIRYTQHDLVLCSEVVEHIAHGRMPDVFANLRRLLKPGGRLVLTTPQPYSTLELCCKLAFLPGIINVVRWIYGEAVERTGHINLMPSWEVELLLEESGFKVKERWKGGLYVPLLAEFGGMWGLWVAQWLEGRVPRWMLWTQGYVCE